MTTVPSSTFVYKGRGADGKVAKGRLEAPNEGAAHARLMKMGLTPISVAETGSGLNREINLSFLKKGVKLKDLAVMARQMATMTGAGVSLLRTLTILSEQSENETLREALEKIAKDVETGSSLSDSLVRHPKIFPPIMINMVRAGETGGFLDGALNTVADGFEKEAKLKASIKSAMTYPMVVLAISLIAVVIMLTFIVPIFAKMFASLGSALPLPTQILVVMSHQMPWALPTLIVAVIAGSVWWRRNKNEPRVRAAIEPRMLKLPVFGMLFTKIAIARFARNFANMMGAGVPILSGLRIVGETSGNWAIETALERVAKAVRQGKSVAEPLAQEPVFPMMVTQMVAVGEDAGSMEVMLNKIADFYDSEVEAMTDSLTSLIEPLLIAFLGVVVGGMIVCLYLPIFQITDAVQNAS
ncbi:type II secretion system F family protein [Gryllotalpicola ginsengisoli]|uniref:type II secretion system F family protein n=1 Tax=Gryllotalpicola ginsengisoli TaxID=444608 RepID=UPI0003B77ECB|nr:type II secretion system F family protein [Gryllotalpicola ginsengisoli]